MNDIRLVFRGNVYIVDLGDNKGSVQSGVRPCVVIGNNMNNVHSSTTQIIPFTTSDKQSLPVHVNLNKAQYPFLNQDSVAIVEQITTVDKGQIRQFIGSLTEKDINKIIECLNIQVGKD